MAFQSVFNSSTMQTSTATPIMRPAGAPTIPTLVKGPSTAPIATERTMNFQAEIANLSYEFAAIASRKVPPARVANRDILQLLNLLKQKNQNTTMTSDTYVRSEMHFSKRGIDLQAIQRHLAEEKYRIDKYIKERARDLNGILFSKIRDERSIPEYVMKYNDVIFLMHVESATQLKMPDNVLDSPRLPLTRDRIRGPSAIPRRRWIHSARNGRNRKRKS